MDLNKYIGIKFVDFGRTFKGADCWGLLRLFYKEEYEIELPSYTEEYNNTKDGEPLSKIINKGKQSWNLIPSGKEQFGDGILLRLKSYPMHIGVVIGNKKMLHVMKGINSVIEQYNGIMWKNKIVGFFRYTGVNDG